MITGIYKIHNKSNNKIYVGSGVDIKKRWRDHKWHLKENKHHNSHLQSSYNKYGLEKFVFSIVEECDVKNLLILERNYIEKYNTFNRDFGYNVNDPEHKFLGRKHSEKTKKILSELKKGKNNPSYGKFGVEHPKFGVKLSKESIEKIRKSKIGSVGLKGEKCPTSKLKELDVINIRNIYNSEKISQRKLGKKYGVSYATIRKIVNRITWTHI